MTAGELRSAVQAAVERYGKSAVARDAGIQRDTLYRFLEGDDLTGPSRAKLQDYVRSLGMAAPAATGGPTAASVYALGVYAGRLEEALRLHQAVGASLGRLLADMRGGAVGVDTQTAAVPGETAAGAAREEKRAAVLEAVDAVLDARDAAAAARSPAGESAAGAVRRPARGRSGSSSAPADRKRREA